MHPTRVDSKKLAADVVAAEKKFDELEKLLKPYLVMISDEERATALRARTEFPEAARALARATEKHPAIAQASGFDAEAVLEDVENAAALAPLVERAQELLLQLNDSKLVWTAEALVPSLAAYNVAKAVAKTDPGVRTLIEPLAEVFAVRKPKKVIENPK